MMIEKAICNLQSNNVVMSKFERKNWLNGILHNAALG